MAKAFKIPKKINGYKLPKKPRKEANRLIAKIQGPELDALVMALMGAVIAHLVERSGDRVPGLKDRLGAVMGGHLRH